MQMCALIFSELKLVYVDYKTASKTFSCPSSALDIWGDRWGFDELYWNLGLIYWSSRLKQGYLSHCPHTAHTGLHAGMVLAGNFRDFFYLRARSKVSKLALACVNKRIHLSFTKIPADSKLSGIQVSQKSSANRITVSSKKISSLQLHSNDSCLLSHNEIWHHRAHRLR